MVWSFWFPASLLVTFPCPCIYALLLGCPWTLCCSATVLCLQALNLELLRTPCWSTKAAMLVPHLGVARSAVAGVAVVLADC